MRMKIKMTSRDFLLIKNYIEEKCGITIGEEKIYLLEARLMGLIEDFRLEGFGELYDKIAGKSHPEIQEKVINAITTNETLWFRDKSPWNVLEDILMPEFIRCIRQGTQTRKRIWSAACATGQEPYSTAMCIDNYLANRGIGDIRLPNFEIFATDISRSVLETARKGEYDDIAMARGLDVLYRNKYFKSMKRSWILNEKIKQAVHFNYFNLQNSLLFLGKFDIIFCRYVTIYFSEKLKDEVLSKMAMCLEPSGVLFLGGSELFQNYREYFELVEYKGGVYYVKK